MLKDDFFKILKKNSDKGEFAFLLEFNREHPIFEGHFKGYPIVPGACLVQMAVEIFAFATQKKYQLKKVKNIKFLNIIKPLENPLIEMDIRCKEVEEKAISNILVVLENGEVCYGKMDLELSLE